jgi:hypothetical protein
MSAIHRCTAARDCREHHGRRRPAGRGALNGRLDDIVAEPVEDCDVGQRARHGHAHGQLGQVILGEQQAADRQPDPAGGNERADHPDDTTTGQRLQIFLFGLQDESALTTYLLQTCQSRPVVSSIEPSEVATTKGGGKESSGTARKGIEWLMTGVSRPSAVQRFNHAPVQIATNPPTINSTISALNNYVRSGRKGIGARHIASGRCPCGRSRQARAAVSACPFA